MNDLPGIFLDYLDPHIIQNSIIYATLTYYKVVSYLSGLTVEGDAPVLMGICFSRIRLARLESQDFLESTSAFICWILWLMTLACLFVLKKPLARLIRSRTDRSTAAALKIEWSMIFDLLLWHHKPLATGSWWSQGISLPADPKALAKLLISERMLSNFCFCREIFLDESA